MKCKIIPRRRRRRPLSSRNESTRSSRKQPNSRTSSRRSRISKASQRSIETQDVENEEYRSEGIDYWFNVLLCRGDLANERFEARPVGFMQMFTHCRSDDRFLLYLGIIASVISGVANPLGLFMIGNLADAMIVFKQDGNVANLWTDALFYIELSVAIGVLLILVSFTQCYCLKKVGTNTCAILKSLYIYGILRQDAYFFDKNKFGSLNSQLTNNVNVVGDGIGNKFGLLIRGMTSFGTIIAISFYYSWRITLVMIGGAPVSCLIISLMANVINKFTVAQSRCIDKSGALLQDSIMNVRTVQSCNGQNQIVLKYSNLLRSGRRFGIKGFIAHGIFDGIFFIVVYLFYAGGIYVGGLLYYDKLVSAADVFVVTSLMMSGTYFLGSMSPHFMAVFKARVATAVLYKKINRVPQIDCYSTEGHVLFRSRGKLEFRGVKFSYPGKRRNEVLKGINWIVEPGETVAIVGKNGCGKSTSVNLLTRVYDCTDGQVLVDDRDIKTLKLHSLRKAIGLIPQEPVLFTGTIADNIQLGNAHISKQRIARACQMANAHAFIKELRKGYLTEVGSGGVQLSVGQKQRIVIARAIANNPKILLIDEATSGLDAESEAHVQKGLKNACRNRTTIIIAHRMTTLKNAKKIIVMDEGKVADIGTHEELMKKNEYYKEMVETQSFGEEDVILDEEETALEEEEEYDQYWTEEIDELFRQTVHALQAPMFRGMALQNKCLDSTTELSVKISRAGTDPDLHTRTPIRLLQLYSTCQSHYATLIAAIIFSCLRGAEVALWIVISKFLFSILADVDSPTFHEDLLRVSLSSVGLGVYSFVVIVLSVLCHGSLTEQVVDSLKTRALKSVLHQGGPYFDEPDTSPSRLVHRITSDTQKIRPALDLRLHQVINNGFCSFVQLIVAFLYSWEVALAGVIYYALLYFLLVFCSKKMQIAVAAKMKNDKTGQTAIEIIENTRTIQLLVKEEYFLDLYIKSIRENLKLEKKCCFYESLVYTLTQSSMHIVNGVVFLVGIYLIAERGYSIDNIYMSAAIMSILCWSVFFISISFSDILHAVPAAQSLIEIIKERPVVDENEKDGLLTKVDGSVQALQLSFAYPMAPHKNIIQDFALFADPGQTIGICGPSGTGKSTFLWLLQRFYDPDFGTIAIDDIQLHRFQLSALRNQMGLVTQEPVLFAGTITENILMGTTEANIDDVVEACRIAHAKKFIEKLPEGYETECGEKGNRLSGGQRQRIAIARALIRQPRILLLDEATSAMDSMSERSVQKALHAASKGRTTITVAHKLVTLINADRIYYIENGRIRECGDHKQLMEMNGRYAAMARRQNLHFLKEDKQ
ncbi:unnamed protein product [Bursaphelenchus xylophilus]|uniref:(pine wood nematode) hypothetical protein n=1 Tax=Bursaphelenchus xylophilus TaxID=6326 RepID=A0A1I7SLI0_BURXY|nr:unnamed protein product [Bursaphelenchus xylophilus]CAG9129608.1 unnamed protein product [Bursaphelenchus xylophilus]